VPALAAGHPAVVSEEVQPICAQMGVDLLAVEAGPNAADRALLSAALRLHAVGVANWFVASHDAVFSALLGSVTILSTGSGRPAQALLQRAVEVRRIA
jgi:hypothetical protein